MPPKRSNLGRGTREAVHRANSRNRETQEQRERRNRATLQRNATVRAARNVRVNLYRAAFNYDSTIEYDLHAPVNIGPMNQICQHCNALKFAKEKPGMCCANGKVQLPALNSPPEPLNSLVLGITPESKHFLSNIQTYNSCFQMTSFGATNIVRDTFMPTFKVISAYTVHNPIDVCGLWT